MKTQLKAFLYTFSILLLLTITIFVFGKTKDFKKIYVGMPTYELYYEVGYPDSKISIISNVSLFIYKEGYLISIFDSKVTSIKTKEQIEEEKNEFNGYIDQINKGLKKINIE